MNSEHVEVLRDLSEVCRAAIAAGDWKVDGACDPDAVLRRADAAIAALSAPQPPAEAQPVGEVKMHGGLLYGQLDRDLPQGTKLYAHPPPSAPVGVEIASLPALWRQREDNGEEHSEYDLGFETASDECARMLEDALAKQPAAVDETAVRWAVERWNDEVANRPLVNVHRRTLDITWRQVIRHFGGDDVTLCGPRHDDLAAQQGGA